MSKLSLRRSVLFIFVLALALAAVLAISQPARVEATTGTICAQYGSTTQGNYIVMNNRWGTSATQCINVTNNGFQIIQQDGVGNTSGAPVSYPAIYAGCHYSNCSPNTNMPFQISAISSANTSTTVTYPSSGTYDAAYDIWINPTTNVSGVQATEIMIWLNHTGSIQPIGSNTGNVTLGGHTWAVWVGNNGQNNVVSYQSAGLTSFSADIKPFLLDAMTRGNGYGNTSWYLTSIQMGFEPWVGGVGLAVDSFSATVSGGGSTNPTATKAPATPTFVPPTATKTGPTPTKTNTPTGPTPTKVPATSTPTSGGGSTCTPTSTISAPFTYDGAGNFCWKTNNLGSYVNDWNLNSLTINGVNETNLYVASSNYPPKASDGYWYVAYNSSVSYGHFETK